MLKPVNVLIVGANFVNKGAEAMLLTVKRELLLKIEDVQFFMLCRSYEKELAENKGIIPVFEDQHSLQAKISVFADRVKGKIIKTITGKNKPYYFPFPFKQIEKKIKKIDLIIDISGFAYSDSWGKPMVMETIRLLNFSKKHHSKFYFLPQAWGSFNNPDVAKATAEMLNKSDKFYARDLVSQKYLASLLKKKTHEIPLLHDIVFAYEEENVKTDVLLKTGYKKTNRLLIGISPNLRVYEKGTTTGKDNDYIQLLLQLCYYCITTLQADVLFIPNEIFPLRQKDDRYVCKILYEALNDRERSFILNDYYSASEIKYCVSQVDFLISSRFHALIFGLLHSKPVMAISWSHKYKELFSLFEMEEFVLEWNAADKESALMLLQNLVSKKEEVKNKISLRLPSLKSEVNRMFQNIAADVADHQ